MPTSQRRLLIVNIALCFFSLSPWMAIANDRPNIVIILCDDLGYGDLACYGNETIRTPHLDRLASQGTRLTDCYSASPLCSPARAGLLTGRTPSRCGIYSWIAPGNPMHLKTEETTIAEIVKDAGYDTCHVGKWHLNGFFNDPRHSQPNDHGFDHWFSTQNNAAPTHHDPKNFVRNGQAVGQLEGYSCQLVASEAIGWLESRAGADSPFFLFVCFHEPHEPIDSPPELMEHYPQAVKKGEALYYANVENMDAATGRLMAALDRLELTDSTLVFFTSDNGPETLNRYKNAWRSHGSPGPLRGMKLHVHDGGIRVPGIVRWPGQIVAGAVSSVPVSAVDLFPTICDILGIDPPSERVLDGQTVVNVFSGEPFQRDKPLFWHYYGAYNNRQVAIRDDDWKMVAGWDGNPRMSSGGSLRPGIVDSLKSSNLVKFELYNVADDIDESDDLSTARPREFARYRETARAMYREVIEEGPQWEFPSR